MSITWLSAIHFEELRHDEAYAHFKAVSEKIIGRIRSSVKIYEYGLRGARGVFIVNNQVDEKYFRLYSKSRDYKLEFPGALGFGFIERVPRKNQEAFLKKCAKEGMSDFKIKTLNEHQNDLYIIKYIEPYEINRKARGLDVASEENRFDAAYKSMRSGKATLTEPITLVQDQEKHIGALYLLPVYAKNVALNTESERIKHLIGWTYAPVVFQNSFNQIMKDYDQEIDLEIYTEKKSLVYDAEMSLQSTHQSNNQSNRKYFTYTTQVEVGGNLWTFNITSLRHFYQKSHENLLLSVWLIGILLSLFLSISWGMMNYVKIRSLNIANEMSLKYKTLKEKAELHTQNKSELLAHVGHELKTPLNGILGLGQLLNESNLDPNQKILSDGMIQSGNSMLRILNEILDFSKIESGKLTLENNTIHLKTVLESSFNVYKNQFEKKGIDTKLFIDNKISPLIISDDLRLRQIFSNLLSNALKFTFKGTISIEAHLLSEENDFQKIEFLVKDTGMGIKKDEINKLFARFSQANSEISKQYGGTGLGLSILKSIIELMDGDIWIESEVNLGTTVHVHLKFKKSSHLLTQHDPDLKTLHKLRKVLIVEDNNINQIVANKILSDFDFNVQLASSVTEANALLEHQQYSLYLLDLNLIDGNGFDLAKFIRQTEKEKSVIIALSGEDQSLQKIKALEAGMDEYIEKPLTKSKLAEVLKKWSF